MMPVKADLAICRSAIGVSEVWLSCQAITLISVLAGLFRKSGHIIICMHIYLHIKCTHIAKSYIHTLLAIIIMLTI